MRIRPLPFTGYFGFEIVSEVACDEGTVTALNTANGAAIQLALKKSPAQQLLRIVRDYIDSAGRRFVPPSRRLTCLVTASSAIAYAVFGSFGISTAARVP